MAQPQIENPPKPESPPLPRFETLDAEQPDPHSQSPPISDPIARIPFPQSQSTDTTATEFSQSTSKIPIRPPKIRKLSNADKPSAPRTTADDSPSLSTAKNRRRSASQVSRIAPQIIKPLSSDGEIELAIRHLQAADPLLAPLINTLRPPEFETHLLPFHALVKSILYQQLATKAGDTIYNRFVSLCGDMDSPDSVLALSSQQLKQIGVSGRKASYLSDLANKYKSGILSDDMVVKMDDRSLFTMLSMVKGIGSWSVHMFMVYSLQRPDVLPVSDLQVRKGVQLLYGLDELPRPSQMELLCEKWRPYRSVGAWYMWRYMEEKTTGSASGAPQGSFVQPLQQIDPHQHQLQFVEPVNGMGNIGACIWNQ